MHEEVIKCCFFSMFPLYILNCGRPSFSSMYNNRYFLHKRRKIYDFSKTCIAFCFFVVSSSLPKKTLLQNMTISVAQVQTCNNESGVPVLKSGHCECLEQLTVGPSQTFL
jgi:hypothetical protein